MGVKWAKLYSLIPNKVQIAKNRFYSIYWKKDAPSEKYLGEADYNKNIISLIQRNSKREMTCTYLHELTHAFQEHYDMGLTEVQVQKLESALYYILKEGNIFKKEGQE